MNNILPHDETPDHSHKSWSKLFSSPTALLTSYMFMYFKAEHTIVVINYLQEINKYFTWAHYTNQLNDINSTTITMDIKDI
jgi:hypothetical protein